MTAILAVYEIAMAKNKVQEINRQGAIVGGSLLGGALGSAAVSLVCGPGAPVCAIVLVAAGAAPSVWTGFDGDAVIRDVGNRLAQQHVSMLSRVRGGAWSGACRNFPVILDRAAKGIAGCEERLEAPETTRARWIVHAPIKRFQRQLIQAMRPARNIDVVANRLACAVAP